MYSCNKKNSEIFQHDISLLRLKIFIQFIGKVLLELRMLRGRKKFVMLYRQHPG